MIKKTILIVALVSLAIFQAAWAEDPLTVPLQTKTMSTINPDDLNLTVKDTSFMGDVLVATIEGHVAIRGWAIDNMGTGYGLRAAGTAVGLYGRGKVIGVEGSGESYGVYGESISGYGVYAQSINGVGIYGKSENSTGVSGRSNSIFGVFGYSITNDGVRGQSASGFGVHGFTSAADKAGVYGDGGSNSVGVKGYSISSAGGSFESTSGTGVYGKSDSGFGIRGVTAGTDKAGVIGDGGNNSEGVQGLTNSSAKAALWGKNTADGPALKIEQGKIVINSSAVGTVTIADTVLQVIVETNYVAASSIILLTGRNLSARDVWVGSVNPGVSFTIRRGNSDGEGKVCYLIIN
ncbi:hypothetical protein A3J44_06170 [candidate division WOR-1 bacterium RIFCSPHIGHO2_02_FULL_45_12]|nr:MAG: hypothetical protein A3J44_06170 [candidate division WOR-1 bacterium RIFCSPHIGHO2_02_FULL_45_12]